MYINLIQLVAFAALASCQTPPDYSPTTRRPLTVKYDDLTIVPDALVSQNATTQQPAISLPHHLRCKEVYMLLMLDLSLPTGNLPSNLTYAHTVHGIGANRTTYLHWFQGNLTHSPTSNLLVPLPDTETIAPYVPPSPNPGDIAHIYAFYLFRQPKDFALSSVNAGRVLFPAETYDRIGFSVQDVAKEKGVELVAGNYFRMQTPA
ncbi:hypothetical protein PRZ48_005953 [Zasmidium cellare]|uniref:PEBP-like protein n=1 Tax=Zasmidium cellare TaxID=395010 RepID=A0ABR0EN29_ZASCE|nr:hypothetical protein PRZ48_005953 [Zasmidium cellare]